MSDVITTAGAAPDSNNTAERVFQINGLSHFLPLVPAFNNFTDLLLEANAHFNLTAIRDRDSVWVRHFADSLLFCDLVPQNANLVDVGCGAGFPSVPLAIARPDVRVTALDATKKKTDFVTAAALALGLNNVTALCARAEEITVQNRAVRDSFDCAVARAVAPLPALCEYVLPFLKSGGVFIAYKGKDAKEETDEARSVIAAIGGTLDDIVTRTLTDPLAVDPENATMSRSAVIITKISSTPAFYPRKNSLIRKK